MTMRVDEILEQMESVLANGMLIPMAKKNNVIINANELRALIDQLEDVLPVELEEAQNILRQKEQLLASARAEANAIIQNAEESRKSMVSNSEIIRAAESKAKTVLFNANTKAAELNRASMEYIENNLKEAEEALAKSLQTVHAAKQAFAAKKQK